MLKRKYNRVVSIIDEEYKDSKLRLKPKLNNGILNQSWSLKRNYKNLNIRNRAKRGETTEEESENNTGTEIDECGNKVLDNHSFHALIMNSR